MTDPLREARVEDERMALCLQELAEGGQLLRSHLEYLRRATRNDPAREPLLSLGLDVARVFRQRVEWFGRACHLCPRTSLEMSGRREEVSINRVELWRFYVPIGQALVHRARSEDSVRVLAGVAGPPGSGKSIFSALLTAVINASLQKDQFRAVRCSLDGFHFPNEYLATHFVRSGRKKVPLQSRKGAPETFDVDGFLSALQRLSSEPEVSMPRYDRQLHEPVPDAVKIMPAHQIVIVEGNYLLLEEGRWVKVRDKLAPCLFLSIPLEAVKRRLIERHMRGGRERNDAGRHFERVDRPNFERCMAGSRRADVIVHRNTEQQIEGVSNARM